MSDAVAEPARTGWQLVPALKATLALYAHRSLFAAWGAAVPLGVALSAGLAQLPHLARALTEPGGLLLADLAHYAVQSDLRVLPVMGWLALGAISGLVPLCFAVRSMWPTGALASTRLTLQRTFFVWAAGVGTLLLLGILGVGASIVVFAWLHRSPNERFADLASLCPLLLAAFGLAWHGAWLDAAYVKVATQRGRAQAALADSLSFVRSRAARVGLAQSARWLVGVILILGTELGLAAMPPGALREWSGVGLRQLCLLVVVALRVLWLGWLQRQLVAQD